MTQTVDIKKEAGTLEGKEAEEGREEWGGVGSLSLSWFGFKAGFGHEEWAKRGKRGEAITHTHAHARACHLPAKPMLYITMLL